VAISDRTRKLLWGRAGDRCAICRKPLSRDPEHGADRVAVIGEECHIVGRSPDGPRGGGDSGGDLDGYENLVLLCAIDHAVVDRQQESWTATRLREVKAAHERWVAARLAERRVQPEMLWQWPGRRTTDVESIRSGSQLMGLYARVFSDSIRLPERLDSTPRELVGAIFRTAQEWGDIWVEVPLDQKLAVEAELDAALDELTAEGFMVLGGVRQMLLSVDGQDSPWPEALIFVRSDAEIETMLQAEEAKASGSAGKAHG
jgi:hypothetical protein